MRNKFSTLCSFPKFTTLSIRTLITLEKKIGQVTKNPALEPTDERGSAIKTRTTIHRAILKVRKNKTLADTPTKLTSSPATATLSTRTTLPKTTNNKNKMTNSQSGREIEKRSRQSHFSIKKRNMANRGKKKDILNRSSSGIVSRSLAKYLMQGSLDRLESRVRAPPTATQSV